MALYRGLSGNGTSDNIESIYELSLDILFKYVSILLSSCSIFFIEIYFFWFLGNL